jgi:hypothetical protein
MKPDLSFFQSQIVNEALNKALVRYVGLMTVAAGQDALDALAVVRAEAYLAAKEAGLSEDHLKQLDWMFNKTTFDAHAAFAKAPRS